MSSRSASASGRRKESQQPLTIDRIDLPPLVQQKPGDYELAHRQTRVLTSLILGYAGYYFLRTNLTVSLGAILHSLPGVSKADFGSVLSIGYVVYAIGKFLNGALADSFGGALVFIGGLVGSVLATVLMVAISPAKHNMHLYGWAWALNRYAQSAGWGALVNLLSKWFPAHMHGRTLGYASMSYGFGEVFIRLLLGALLAAFSPLQQDDKESLLTPEQSATVWHGVFWVSIVCAIALILPAFFWLRNSPQSIGLSLDGSHQRSSADPLEMSRFDDVVNIDSSEPHQINTAKPTGPQTVKFLLQQPKFYCLLLCAPCLTLIRETISTWSVVFFLDTIPSLSDSTAAILSLLFPLFGTLSTLLGGWTMDWLTHTGRADFRPHIPVVMLMCLTISLLVLAGGSGESATPFSAGMLISSCAFFLMAPYSFIEGLFILSLTPHNPGIAVGLINSVGYVGAILAGHEVGAMASWDGWGWHRVWLVMAGVSLVTVVGMSGFAWVEMKERLGAGGANAAAYRQLGR